MIDDVQIFLQVYIYKNFNYYTNQWTGFYMTGTSVMKWIKLINSPNFNMSQIKLTFCDIAKWSKKNSKIFNYTRSEFKWVKIFHSLVMKN